MLHARASRSNFPLCVVELGRGDSGGNVLDQPDRDQQEWNAVCPNRQWLQAQCGGGSRRARHSYKVGESGPSRPYYLLSLFFSRIVSFWSFLFFCLQVGIPYQWQWHWLWAASQARGQRHRHGQFWNNFMFVTGSFPALFRVRSLPLFVKGYCQHLKHFVSELFLIRTSVCQQKWCSGLCTCHHLTHMHLCGKDLIMSLVVLGMYLMWEGRHLFLLDKL